MNGFPVSRSHGVSPQDIRGVLLECRIRHSEEPVVLSASYFHKLAARYPHQLLKCTFSYSIGLRCPGPRGSPLDPQICRHGLKLDGSSKVSSSVPADALDHHSFPRQFVNVVCRSVGSRMSFLQSSDALVAGSFVLENLKPFHSSHVRVKTSLQVCMTSPGSFRTSASASVGKSSRFAFAAHCTPYVPRDTVVSLTWVSPRFSKCFIAAGSLCPKMSFHAFNVRRCFLFVTEACADAA